MQNESAGIKRRLHFGVMIPNIDDTSQLSILDGIAEVAKINDIHLTAYICTYQTIVYYENTLHYDTCFAAIRNSNSLDGLILFSGFTTNHIGLDDICRELSMFHREIPMISVSLAVPDIPTVLTDNVNGIFYAVDHLIKKHDKKQIAFIMGPDGHQEAEERLEGYKKALAENGIPFDERYVLPGNFSIACGHKAVAELIDVRKIPFDAIATSDDGTAKGALNELRSRGILVPTGVSVTGFDDDSESGSFIPSITTVQQNFFEIGKVSALKLLKRVNGIPVDDVTTVTPVFIARQSCGCLDNTLISGDPDYDIAPGNEDSLFSFLYERLKIIFMDDAPPQEIQGWVTTLVGKLINKPFNSEDFLKQFDEIIINYNNYSRDYSQWHEAVSVLTMAVEQHGDEIDCTQSVMSTLILATALINDICVRNEIKIELSLIAVQTALRRVASTLISKFDIDSLAEELYKTLPMLSLNTALLGLYHSHISINDPDAHRAIDTLIGFDGEQKLNVKNVNSNAILYSDYFRIDEFDFERERRTLFFYPLFFEDEEIGILLLPYDRNIRVNTYETLRINISAAIKGAQLLSRIQALSVTDELTGLFNRRGFFQFAESRLDFLSRNPDMVASVLLMDMDGLKNINDTYGHSEGDIALSAFADVLRMTLRKEDIVGRLGGDEFIVLSSITSDKSSKLGNNEDLIIKRIQDSLDSYNSRNVHPYKLSTSIGSVVLAEATDECLNAAILSADSILYEEKAKKRQQGLNKSRE